MSAPFTCHMEAIQQLEQSLERLMGTGNRHVILCGDLTVPMSTIPVTLCKPVVHVDLAVMFNLNQINEIPTREDNLLDIMFTTNPSFIKSSVNVPDISDHDIIITESFTKLKYIVRKGRKCYIFKQANIFKRVN